MIRKRIAADYERRLDADGKERYVYTGPGFEALLMGRGRVRFLLMCWLVPVLSLAVLVAVGLLDNDGARRVYIVMPYMILYFPLALLVGDAYKISTGRRRMERREYEKSYLQMRHCTVAVIVLSLVLVVGTAVLLITAGSGTVRREYFFMLGIFAILVTFVLFLRAQLRVQWKSDGSADGALPFPSDADQR